MPLVSCDRLARHLDDPAWRVFDCCTRLGDPTWGDRRFAEGHVPGAQRADVDRDLSDPVRDGSEGRHPLPEPRRFQDFLRRTGVDADTKVVVYDHEGGWWASRLWWLARDAGIDAVLLDGGLTRWRAQGLPLETGPARRRPRTDITLRPGGMPTVQADTLPAVLLDARAPPRYRGEVEPIDPVAGHIPGARNVPAQSLVGGDLRLLPPAKLQERLQDAGAEAACYCGSGVTATFLVLAMTAAGLPVPALYPGSLSQWCAQGRPVAVTQG